VFTTALQRGELGKFSTKEKFEQFPHLKIKYKLVLVSVQYRREASFLFLFLLRLLISI